MLNTNEEIHTIEQILKKAGVRANFEFFGDVVFFRHIDALGQDRITNVTEFINCSGKE